MKQRHAFGEKSYAPFPKLGKRQWLFWIGIKEKKIQTEHV